MRRGAGYRWVIRLGAGLLLCLGGGCGQPDPKPTSLSPLPSDAVILAYMAGVNPVSELYQDRGFQQTIQEVLDRRVVSGGKQAEGSADALKRLPGLLNQVKPNLMILGYGLTDLQRGYDKEALKENLRAMIALARDRGTEVMLVSMPGKDISMKPAPLYAELAQELGVPIEGRIAFEILRTHSLKGERWTLNDAGLKRFSEAIRDLLISEGALPEVTGVN